MKRILLIEDNEIDAVIASKIIEYVDNTYQLEQATSGREALAILKSSKELPNLILLDLVLPVIDGFEFLKIMSEEADYRSIPVIIYSSSLHSRDKERAYTYKNVSAFISKPMSMEDFISALNKAESANPEN